MSKSDLSSQSISNSSHTSDIRVGVYLCHCGVNIGGVINMTEMVEFAKTLPDVVIARDYKFYCSDNGQAEIAKDIREGLINRVVVAACSPRMHESTFRRVLVDEGLNPFYFVQANIREHATWVNMYDSAAAQRISQDHLRMQVAKVRQLKALEPQIVMVRPSSLIIGAGIAGINTALDLGNQGFKVYLVEKDATIGGHMAQLDKTFPTMDCSSCILTPKMVEVSRNPNITIMAYSEVEKVDGYVGNFQVQIRRKTHYVDQSKCTGCGECALHCPVAVGNDFDLGMSHRSAIYIPFPQAVPGLYTIDMDHCIKCGICASTTVCEPQAINFDDHDKIETVEVGTIIVATGFDPVDVSHLGNYGYGRFENVITGLEMERNLSSTGPNLGHPVRPSDGQTPRSIAWLQCVGSRDTREGNHPYCSRVCCMYALKQARQYKEKHPDAECYIFYMDIRAFGKGYEEFYESASHEYGIKFMRGRLAEIQENPDKSLLIRAEDTFLGQPLAFSVDMVVLSNGVEARSDSDKVASLVAIQKSADGFFMEAHPKLRQVDSLTDGVYIAGVAQGPKDIPDVVSQAKGAASGAAILMSQGEVEVEPYFSIVQTSLCSGCRSCISQCPFGAITFDTVLQIAHINPAQCKGCGTCVSTCPSNAILQNHFTTKQLMAIIEGVLGDDRVW
ncbi:MAG: CoB--CoM heterodisulfide reductase iron-sulfur subunit A family protein [Promethearchaeota archaeon]|nr:MAG: CoB--CoM heterodisulfide reductase iron-sulfur subunit A family protein [Candidatus Lokiarchaeota archaeon]